MRDSLPEHRNYGKNSFSRPRKPWPTYGVAIYQGFSVRAARIQEKTKRGSTITVDETRKFRKIVSFYILKLSPSSIINV